MMKESNKLGNPFVNTLRIVEHQLVQNTVNVQHAEAAVSIGRLDLSYKPDKEFYDELYLTRDCLVCIAGNNIYLN